MVKVYAFRAPSTEGGLDLGLVKKVVELGADGVVLDVFLSRDDVPVASAREEAVRAGPQVPHRRRRAGRAAELLGRRATAVK